MHLWPKYVKGDRVHIKEIIPVKLTPDQININTLFEEFWRLQDFNCGEGIILPDVSSWIMERKKAYAVFREKFSQDKLVNWEKLGEDFRDFLHFKNNFSWTTLYRTGLKALNNLERLWKLLIFVQDESIDVQKRVQQGLQGGYYCQGIGKGILTALLHTFDPDKYGVWNSRTDDTLEMIRRTPSASSNIGHRYQLINNELIQLKNELNTDLTTIDSFMWFISKKVQVIE
jgi:hypothetical protein